MSSTDGLWLDTLHRICGRAAHELKGVLNGVSVNLEVVRSRSAKAETPSSAIGPYANAASTQFDAVIDMTEALLALARPAAHPVDIGATVRRVEALLGPVMRVDGKRLDVDGSLEELGSTPAQGSAVRLAIGASILAAIDSSAQVVCRADGRVLRIECMDGGTAEGPAADAIAAAKSAGIEIRAEPSAISISFPH